MPNDNVCNWCLHFVGIQHMHPAAAARGCFLNSQENLFWTFSKSASCQTGVWPNWSSITQAPPGNHIAFYTLLPVILHPSFVESKETRPCLLGLFSQLEVAPFTNTFCSLSVKKLQIRRIMWLLRPTFCNFCMRHGEELYQMLSGCQIKQHTPIFYSPTFENSQVCCC